MMTPPSESCLSNTRFCNPWRGKPVMSILGGGDSIVAGGGGGGAYSDADLAADMNALSFAERQAMEEDIHGVSDIIEETPEFVTKKIEEMQRAMTKVNQGLRQAWDRATFLRPALADDEGFHLLFLRARRFRPDDAAVLMAAYFRAKRDLWGDDLLLHRITWNDLTEEEQAIFRTGSHRIIPNGDRTGRGVLVVRLSEFAITDNYRSFARRAWYVNSVIEDDPIMQQRGIVTVPDIRGQWKSSHFQILRLLSSFPSDATPLHDASVHVLYDDSRMHDVIQTMRNVFPKSMRVRVRLHYGSPMETMYALRTFGIDILSELFDGFSNANDNIDEQDARIAIEEDIWRRKQLDDEWRRLEAPYCDVSSPIALFPNPQDIIMGRNKAIAMTWPGNVMFRKVIQEYVSRYIEKQDEGSNRISKTMIAIEILLLLHNQYKSRFLNWENTGWVVIEDIEARTKISQALRM